ncbi:hypothetical protein SUGI_0463380 [Cryptomeria japonica]|nr:hypothetical protein SUGI_0463380 [Cryptomeria japonica]
MECIKRQKKFCSLQHKHHVSHHSLASANLHPPIFVSHQSSPTLTQPSTHAVSPPSFPHKLPSLAPFVSYSSPSRGVDLKPSLALSPIHSNDLQPLVISCSSTSFHQTYSALNSAPIENSLSSVVFLHLCPLQQSIESLEGRASIIVDLGNSLTHPKRSNFLTQPADQQRLLSNSSSLSNHGTLALTLSRQSEVSCFNCSIVSCNCGCVSCKLCQPRALTPSLHLSQSYDEVLFNLSSHPCHMSSLDKVAPSPTSHHPFSMYSSILPKEEPINTSPSHSFTFLGVSSCSPLSSTSLTSGRFPPPQSSPNLLPINNWESKLVVNLSHVVNDPLAFNFLKRGLNFALAPRSIPHVDFLIDIENAALPIEVAEEVRQDCIVALQHAKPPKCNIPKDEILAFKNLMSNNDLIISRADKGVTKELETLVLPRGGFTAGPNL